MRVVDPGTKRFVQQRDVWTPDLWDDGYVNNSRFRVYRPDYPRAYAMGYALRAHVVWWLAHCEAHPEGFNLHHRNEDKLDDRLENLELIEHAEHVRLHKPKRMKVCGTCGVEFYKPKKPQAKYCCYECYTKAPRSAETRAKMSAAQSLRWAA